MEMSYFIEITTISSYSEHFDDGLNDVLLTQKVSQSIHKEGLKTNTDIVVEELSFLWDTTTKISCYDNQISAINIGLFCVIFIVIFGIIIDVILYRTGCVSGCGPPISCVSRIYFDAEFIVNYILFVMSVLIFDV